MSKETPSHYIQGTCAFSKQSMIMHNFLHKASIDYFVNEVVFNANVSQHGEAHASHLISHILYLTTKPYSLLNTKTTHINICQRSSHNLPFEPQLPYGLAHTQYDVRWSIRAQVMRNQNSQLCTHCCKQCDTMLCLYSYSTMLSTHLQPSPILAQISLTTTMCTLNCNIHW